MRVLWTDIVIDTQNPSSLIQHLSTLSPTSAVFDIIKTVTISGFAPEFEYGGERTPARVQEEKSEDKVLCYNQGCRAARILNSSLVELASVLPRMTQIEAFSFFLKNSCRDKSISRRAMQTVIENLPPSVKNLEIDTRCCDRVLPKDEESHLCDAIAHRMQTLRQLRVRLSTVCPALIGQVDKLESGVICLQWPNRRSHTIPCDLAPAKVHLFGDHRPLMAHNLQSNIINTISSKLTSSATTKRFLLITFRQNAQIGQADIRDFVAKSTISCPVAEIGLTSDDKVPIQIRYPSIDGATKDAAGYISDVEELLETTCGWHFTSQGSRLPDSFRRSARGADVPWVPYDGYSTPETWPWRLRDKKDVAEVAFKMKPRHGFEPPSYQNLWEDEAKAERPLAEIKIMDGVGKTEDLKRLDRAEPTHDDSTLR